MVRKPLALAWTLLALALQSAPAAGQYAAGQQQQRVWLRVLLPEEDAEVLVDGTATKQKGTSRLFESPPLTTGRTYSYTVTAKWWPNNYTEVIRTRTVVVTPGRETEADLRNADPKEPDRFLIRYVPTPNDVVEAMCKLAAVKKGDIVYDLGCGDGRIVIAAVKDFGAARGVGVDIDPKLIEESKKNATEAKLADRVEFRKGDVLNIKDLGDADVVMLYMGEDVNLRLRPILQKTLKPGARVVSHDFGMGDWKPDRMIEVVDEFGDEHQLYLWTIGPQKKK
jgi:uncharacterized protein (TIGR03000 family)